MSTIILILLALGVVALIATRKPRSSDSQMTDVCPADGSPPAPEVTVIDSDGKEITFDQFADRLLQSDIISVGELHDSAAHHEMQLRIIEAVFKRDPDLGVGMEMFQRRSRTFWIASSPAKSPRNNLSRTANTRRAGAFPGSSTSPSSTMLA